MSDQTFEYDESEWPIVHIVSPDGPLDDASLDRNFRSMTMYLERRQPLVFIIELGKSSTLSVPQRDAIRRHEAEQRGLIAQFQRGVAVVTRSTFQRAMINAIFWLIRSPSSTEAFPDVESAKAWARARLGSHRSASTASRGLTG
jgi:hypothetical protein